MNECLSARVETYYSNCKFCDTPTSTSHFHKPFRSLLPHSVALYRGISIALEEEKEEEEVISVGLWDIHIYFNGNSL